MGIVNSEMLLFISLVKYFGVKLIVESGRANGYSTKIIAECFKKPEYKIYSVENNKYSPDVKISFEKLKKYENLILLFGDSFNIIPNLITEKCCILIDGPKGVRAISLAIELLKNPLTKAVFIHDLFKDYPHREDAEKIFSNYFFTDNKDYIEKFKSLDNHCWIVQRKCRKLKSWGPYRRRKKIMKSYGPTLAVFINSDNIYNIKHFNTLLKSIKQWKRSWSIKHFFNNFLTRFKRIIQFPFSYMYYEKRVKCKKQLNFNDLIKKWLDLFLFTIKTLYEKVYNIYKDLEDPLI